MAERTDPPTGGGPAAAERVLLVTPSFSRRGGIAAHVLSSAAALAERGVAVDVLVRSVETDERPAGVRVHESPRLFERGLPAAERLGPCAGAAPSVAHLHQVEDLALIADLQSRSPVLLSVHGYLACTADEYYFQPGRECSRAHGPMCIPNLAFRGCAHTRDPRPIPGAYKRTGREVRAMRTSDMAISYSSAVDRHLANNRIEPRRVIPLFTTVEPPAPCEPQPGRILFAGRVVPSKGLEVLIRAAVELPGACFVVCGTGWQLGEMRRLAARLGVGERFDFRGWVAPAELRDELAAASLLALPSVWPEPFGLVGIEALAAGRPVVASDTGGIRDWLSDGVSGLLAAPGDPASLAARIRELLADPARAAQMGEAGRREVAERHTAAHHASAMLAAYAEARESWRLRGV